MDVIIYLHIYRLIVDPHNNLLPVGLIAQLVEHCTGIAEARVGIPVQAWIFQAFLAASAKNAIITFIEKSVKLDPTGLFTPSND